MRGALRVLPLLTATHRYDKSLSTRHRGAGVTIEAPILAWLVETSQGRILFDVGCDYRKIADPVACARHYDPDTFAFGAPVMTEEDRLPRHLARLGLTTADVDAVFLSHLHFDHAGGLCDLCDASGGPEIQVQRAELEAARTGADPACFADEFDGAPARLWRWKVMHGEYDLLPGVRAVASPGHTAGHMSLWVELPAGSPVVLCGDAADLQENLDDEVAPGLCWQDRVDEAVASIRRLKSLAAAERAELWPNHDMAFYRRLADRGFRAAGD